MKVAIYARISTDEERQTLDTQLLPIRQFCQAQGFEVYREYLDVAPARDLLHRIAWRQLMDDAARHHFKAVVVFKLDRAFRSVKDMHDSLSAWEIADVKLVSTKENLDTSTAIGRLYMNLIASLAEFELEVDRERILAGMERARAQGTRSGKPIGKPRIAITPSFNIILERVKAKELSLGQAAKQTGVSKATIFRWVKGDIK